MAVRDRNLFAWQAYVITMTIVSIGLLMALGFVIFTGSTSKKEAITATKNLQDMEAKLRQEGIKTQYMMYMLGAKQSTEQEVAQMEASIAGIADMEALKKSYQSDMALFGADVAQQDRNYSSLVVNLMKSLRTRNMQNDKASKDIDRLTKEMESVRVQETKGRQAAEAERDRLAKANEDARKDYEAKEGS